MSYMQLSEGDFQEVYPCGLWSWFSGLGVVKDLLGHGSYVANIYMHAGFVPSLC